MSRTSPNLTPPSNRRSRRPAEHDQCPRSIDHLREHGACAAGLASPLNLNFNGAPILGVGSDSTVGSLTIGAGTNLTFTPTTDIARFRVGRDLGGNGTVNMTGGTVTANETFGQYLSLSVGVGAPPARSIKAAAP